ncbi:hypothetical protein ACLOJK_028592 [Asimina triloba]
MAGHNIMELVARFHREELVARRFGRLIWESSTLLRRSGSSEMGKSRWAAASDGFSMAAFLVLCRCAMETQLMETARGWLNFVGVRSGNEEIRWSDGHDYWLMAVQCTTGPEFSNGFLPNLERTTMVTCACRSAGFEEEKAGSGEVLPWALCS